MTTAILNFEAVDTLENSETHILPLKTNAKRIQQKAKKKAKKPITAVSLFSGCGGMDLGFLGGFDFLGKKYAKHAFNIVWANEINATACATVTYRLYLAADYGVPQTRERVFIVGTRPDIPKFIHPKPVCQDHISAKEAIGDLEKLDASPDFNHIWSLANKSGEQGNRKLLAERPSYTMRAECHGNIQFHYSLPRRISMREAARFQAFPDEFRFEAKLRETERQIGNAVPPVLAWHIAQAVQTTLEREIQ